MEKQKQTYLVDLCVTAESVKDLADFLKAKGLVYMTTQVKDETGKVILGRVW